MDAPKVTIKAHEALADIRAHMTDAALMEKYGISERGLQSLFGKLVAAGLLAQAELDNRTDSAEKAVDTSGKDPFELLRGRTLLARALLAVVASIVLSVILLPSGLINESMTLQNIVFLALFNCVLLLLVIRLLSRAQLAPTEVIGNYPSWAMVGRNALLAFPLVGVAIAATYLLYLPLSYLSPRFVEWWILELPPFIVWKTDSGSISGNLLGFLCVVLIAPIVEEFFFRGLLLTRWSVKWNVPWAIFASSALFALGHPDVIGAFFFGYVMCVLYIQTKSLLVPIALHMTNNGMVWIIAGVAMLVEDTNPQATLAQFQSEWWVGLVAGVVVMPWVIIFVKRHMPSAAWRVPYFALREGRALGAKAA
ncbi:MAG: CPBP family intramembrane glutamic endopeptidase [Thermodesulfobacteriota bacterium]